jgi:hypothetical protein
VDFKNELIYSNRKLKTATISTCTDEEASTELRERRASDYNMDAAWYRQLTGRGEC